MSEGVWYVKLPRQCSNAFSCVTGNRGASFGGLGKGIIERTEERQSRPDLESSRSGKYFKRESGRSGTQLWFRMEPYLAGRDGSPGNTCCLSLNTAVFLPQP